MLLDIYMVSFRERIFRQKTIKLFTILTHHETFSIVYVFTTTRSTKTHLVSI